MVGDVSAAIDLVDGDSAAAKEFVAGEDVLAPRVAAEGQDWRMFEEQQGIVDALLMAEFDELLLEGEGLFVVDSSELEKVQDNYSSSRNCWVVRPASRMIVAIV